MNSSKISLAKDDRADIYPAGAAATTTTSSTTTTAASNPSMIFDPGQEEIENDISALINFSPSHPFSISPVFSAQEQDHLRLPSTAQAQVPLTNFTEGGSLTHSYPSRDLAASLVSPTYLPVFEDDCLTSMPVTSLMPLSPTSPSCSFLSPGVVGTAYMPGNLNTAVPADGSQVLMGSLLLSNQMQKQELDYQGSNGRVYCPDSVPSIFKPNNIQVHATQYMH